MTNKRKLVVATRRSALALAQCRQWIQKLVTAYPDWEVEELHVVTTGDRIVDRPLAEIGGKGLFLKEIEEALLEGRADLAVHSMKDVPPVLHPELMLACVPEREDPRDVLISREGVPLLDLPAGSVLGTSSLRRGVQLRRLRPDLRVVPLRGNVGTRIQKCHSGEVDATVLAQAGLNRLGLQVEGAQVLPLSQCLSAVGQGALAIEIRRADTELAARLAQLTHAPTSCAVAAERGVMKALEGDCRTPIAAYAEREQDTLVLRAFWADDQSMRIVERRMAWPEQEHEAATWGYQVGRDILRA